MDARLTIRIRLLALLKGGLILALFFAPRILAVSAKGEGTPDACLKELGDLRHPQQLARDWVTARVKKELESHALDPQTHLSTIDELEAQMRLELPIEQQVKNSTIHSYMAEVLSGDELARRDQLIKAERVQRMRASRQVLTAPAKQWALEKLKAELALRASDPTVTVSTTAELVQAALAKFPRSRLSESALISHLAGQLTPTEIELRRRVSATNAQARGAASRRQRGRNRGTELAPKVLQWAREEIARLSSEPELRLASAEEILERLKVSDPQIDVSLSSILRWLKQGLTPQEKALREERAKLAVSEKLAKMRAANNLDIREAILAKVRADLLAHRADPRVGISSPQDLEALGTSLATQAHLTSPHRTSILRWIKEGLTPEDHGLFLAQRLTTRSRLQSGTRRGRHQSARVFLIEKVKGEIAAHQAGEADRVTTLEELQAIAHEVFPEREYGETTISRWLKQGLSEEEHSYRAKIAEAQKVESVMRSHPRLQWEGRSYYSVSEAVVATLLARYLTWKASDATEQVRAGNGWVDFVVPEKQLAIEFHPVIAYANEINGRGDFDSLEEYDRYRARLKPLDAQQRRDFIAKTEKELASAYLAKRQAMVASEPDLSGYRVVHLQNTRDLYSLLLELGATVPEYPRFSRQYNALFRAITKTRKP